MSDRKNRMRSVLALACSLGLSIWALSSDAQAARHKPVNTKGCSYAGQSYSIGACRGGQRCVHALNDDDYWQDDTNCPQVSPGIGGRMVV